MADSIECGQGVFVRCVTFVRLSLWMRFVLCWFEEVSCLFDVSHIGSNLVSR